jgi:hypothetical protein
MASSKSATTFACQAFFMYSMRQSPAAAVRSRMEAYNIQLESRRLCLSFLCGAKKVNKVIPAAHIPQAQAYAEMEMPASVLQLILANDSHMRT